VDISEISEENIVKIVDTYTQGSIYQNWLKWVVVMLKARKDRQQWPNHKKGTDLKCRIFRTKNPKVDLIEGLISDSWETEFCIEVEGIEGVKSPLSFSSRSGIYAGNNYRMKGAYLLPDFFEIDSDILEDPELNFLKSRLNCIHSECYDAECYDKIEAIASDLMKYVHDHRR
jgi:hypothetical protein